MAATNSPNMNLPIPAAGTTAGPDYATDINDSLTLVDGHDHTPGYGVQITPDGININGSLAFNNHSATSLAGLNLTAQNSTPGVNTIYESGVDLYYVDGLGNNIQLTSNGGVAGSPGSISNLTSPASAAYVAGSSTFVWESDTSIAANMDGGSVILRNLSPNSTYGITLSPPAALAANYTITLPALPAATNFVTITSSGTLAAGAAISKGLTAAMIADATLTTTQISATAAILGSQLSASANIVGTQLSATAAIAGTQLSSTAGILPGQLAGPYTNTAHTTASYSNATTSFTTAISNFSTGSVTTLTATRPVIISAKPAAAGEAYVGITCGATAGANTIQIQLIKQTSVVVQTFEFTAYDGGASTLIKFPISSLQVIDFVDSTDASNGTITYFLQAKVITNPPAGTATARIVNLSMQAAAI